MLMTLVQKNNDISLGKKFALSFEHFDTCDYPVSTDYQGVVAGPQSPQVSLNCFEESEAKTAIKREIEESRGTLPEEQWQAMYSSDFKKESESQD